MNNDDSNQPINQEPGDEQETDVSIPLFLQDIDKESLRKWRKNRGYFEANRNALFEKHGNQFIAILDCHVIDVDESLDALMLKVNDMYGDINYYIDKPFPEVEWLNLPPDISLEPYTWNEESSNSEPKKRLIG